MNIHIVTLFPEMFSGPFNESIIKRAQDKMLARLAIYNLRDWALDARGTVDDRPYGGGTGMLLRPEPLFNAVGTIRDKQPKTDSSKVILLDAGGIRYNQKKAQEYAKLDSIILLCGHYEGVDYRVHEHLADEVVSIGDYVLTGGEIPAMILVDSVIRLIPGVLEKEDATEIESFGINNETKQLVEFPQYTRPEEYLGHTVPEILTSGNHGHIDTWRKEQALKRTKVNRPDL